MSSSSSSHPTPSKLPKIHELPSGTLYTILPPSHLIVVKIADPEDLLSLHAQFPSPPSKPAKHIPIAEFSTIQEGKQLAEKVEHARRACSVACTEVERATKEGRREEEAQNICAKALMRLVKADEEYRDVEEQWEEYV